jgi:hypothetical protein
MYLKIWLYNNLDMFTYLTWYLTTFWVFSRELANQLNRFKKSTRANSRSSANRVSKSRKWLWPSIFSRVVLGFSRKCWILHCLNCLYTRRESILKATYRMVIDDNFLNKQWGFILIGVHNVFDNYTTLFLQEEQNTMVWWTENVNFIASTRNGYHIMYLWITMDVVYQSSAKINDGRFYIRSIIS